MSESLYSHLKSFGFDEFKPGQREIIESVINGKDTLGVLPTGGGKSLCYQLPALMLSGTVLVISPLIALMKDQVDALAGCPLKAEFINSSINRDEESRRLFEMASGGYQILYISPERLRNRRFQEMIRQIRISLVAIDEAHCISEWGHDFRPDYLRIKEAVKWLGRPVCLALTATATPDVREDIIRQLEFVSPGVVITGFDRANLSYSTHKIMTSRQKKNIMLDIVKARKGSGIIYTSTRKDADSVARLLKENNIPVYLYHAGLRDDDRIDAQEKFMSSLDGVMVSTNAFGMGIDKRDIRFILHYQIPGSPESYYQEAGRAGRDKNPADCTLLYHPIDKRIQEFFIRESYPSPQMIEDVYSVIFSIKENPVLKTYQQLKELMTVEISERGISTAMHLLERAGVISLLRRANHLMSIRLLLEVKELHSIKLSPSEQIMINTLTKFYDNLFEVGAEINPDIFSGQTGFPRIKISRLMNQLAEKNIIEYLPPFTGRGFRIISSYRPFKELEIDFDTLLRRKSADEKRLEQMIDYATTNSCLRNWILKYFGETPENDNCGNCMNCISVRSDVNQLDNEQFYSIIAELVSRVKGSFGKIKLAQILTGSKSAYIKRMRLNHLPQYGCISLAQDEVVLIIEKMINIGLLEQTDGMYPTIEVTKKGLELLNNKPAVILPESASIEKKYHRKLYNDLRDLKNRIAIRTRLPNYCIIGNHALLEMASRLPTTKDELLKIKGVGERIADKYGDGFISVIKRYMGDHSSTPRKPAKDVEKTEHLTTSSKTYEMYKKGYTVYEISKKRGLDESTIFSHLAREYSNNNSIDIEMLISREKIELIKETIKTNEGVMELEAIKRLLPSDVSFGEIELVFGWLKSSVDVSYAKT